MLKWPCVSTTLQFKKRRIISGFYAIGLQDLCFLSTQTDPLQVVTKRSAHLSTVTLTRGQASVLMNRGMGGAQVSARPTPPTGQACFPSPGLKPHGPWVRSRHENRPPPPALPQSQISRVLSYFHHPFPNCKGKAHPTVRYYSAVRRNEVLIRAIPCINLADTLLVERSQA